MLISGIILVTFIGFLAVNAISPRFTWAEKTGLAFPIGLGLQTLVMLVMDMLGIRLTRSTVMLAGSLLMVASCLFLYRHRKEVRNCCKNAFRFDSSQYNLVWFFFIVLIIYFEYMNFAKCLYFPTFDRDSLAGFDTIGYVVSREHTFRGLSIFRQEYMPHIHDAGSYIRYAPMVQLSYAYVYLLGAETSKLVPALMYLSLLTAFYGSIRRVTGPTASAIATFFMMITPEMIAFSSLSGTNVIHAVSASLGIIYFSLWFRYRERRDLYLGSVLLALNVWTRTDGVVFIGAAFLVVFGDVVRSKRWRDLLPIAASCFPALLWALFAGINNFRTESMVIIHPHWNAEKAGIIWAFMKAYYCDTWFFGWTFVVFFFSFLLNGWNLVKKKDNFMLLAMIVLSSFLYMWMLYQIDYKWDSIQNVLAYSAKRFLFCFIPVIWYYSMSNQCVVQVFQRMDDFLLLREHKVG